MGTIPSAERREQWQEEQVPLFRDYLSSRIIELSEVWKAEKAAKEQKVRKRECEEGEEEVVSEGEVDIVHVLEERKVTPQRRKTRR